MIRTDEHTVTDNLNVDIAIVGGGLQSAAIACEAVRLGLTAVLIETDRPELRDPCENLSSLMLFLDLLNGRFIRFYTGLQTFKSLQHIHSDTLTSSSITIKPTQNSRWTKLAAGIFNRLSQHYLGRSGSMIASSSSQMHINCLHIDGVALKNALKRELIENSSNIFSQCTLDSVHRDKKTWTITFAQNGSTYTKVTARMAINSQQNILSDPLYAARRASRCNVQLLYLGKLNLNQKIEDEDTLYIAKRDRYLVYTTSTENGMYLGPYLSFNQSIELPTQTTLSPENIEASFSTITHNKKHIDTNNIEWSIIPTLSINEQAQYVNLRQVYFDLEQEGYDSAPCLTLYGIDPLNTYTHAKQAIQIVKAAL